MIPEDNTTRIKVIFFAVVIVFIALPLLIYVIVSTRKDSIPVRNYDSHIKDLPSKERSAINTSLYTTVQLNLVKGEKMMRSSALIRKGSASTTYDSDRDVHSGSFIIDLKDIRQSYLATYDWSENADNPNISGYPATVRCVSDTELVIYKDFDCKDGTESSALPLEYQLPYTDVNGPFKIVYMYKQGNTPVIGISNSTPNGRKKALNWLRSKNIDPATIHINYMDMNDQLRRFSYGNE